MRNLLSLLMIVFVFAHTGCATLFGWDIHAPGILSEGFTQKVSPVNQRIALYVPPSLLTYESTDKGGQFADPQTYYVGDALGPMLVEAFQTGFSEFIFMEVDPTAPMLKQYGIPYLAAVRVKDFRNRVTLKGQAITLVTETIVFDTDLNLLVRFESRGTSAAQKVFAKKGGPEVNLNAAVENNVLAIVQYLQDGIQTGAW